MPKPTPTFYVFHGTDEFTRAETLASFKRRLGPPDSVDLNTMLLDGGRLTLAELRHACDAIPFLAERRLVIVEGLLARLASRKGQELSAAQREYLAALADYLPRLPETTRLVFVEEKRLPANHAIVQLAGREERGYVKRFDPPAAKVLPRWINERAREHGGVNVDLVIAGALLHDVGKVLEYAQVDGKTVKSKMAGLRHPVSGAGLAMKLDLPYELVHIIANHSKEGDFVKKIPEVILIHHVDFVDFDIAKALLAAKK